MSRDDGRARAVPVPAVGVLTAALLATAMLTGCRDGGSKPPPVASGTPTATAPPTFVPPADAAQFWARLRALHPKLEPVGPGKPAAETARVRACHELGALLRYVDDNKDKRFRVENSDFDSLENDSRACLRPEDAQQRLAWTDVGLVLDRDPFATPTP